MSKLVVNFCPTGMVPTKALTPFIPVSVAEIVEQVHEAWEIGITLTHLHARNDDGSPTWRPEVYRDIFEGIRKHCPVLILCGSSSGRDWAEFEKRAALLELRPDMCSLTLSSLNFMQQSSINAPSMIQQLAKKMTEYGVHPELEAFDLGMVNYGQYLIKKGILKGPYYWNLLFGNIAGMQLTPGQISAAVEAIPPSHHLAFAGLGETALPAHSTAIALGYGVRVGLEDTIWFDRGKSRKATNSDLLKRVHELMYLNERSLMTAKEFGSVHGFYNRTSMMFGNDDLSCTTTSGRDVA